jgi:hypothetical protein
MALVVPNTVEVAILEFFLKTTNSILRLYSNDVTPSETSSSASFTEVSGGGYVAKTLVAANWAVVSGDPSFGVYNQQEFVFTGVTGGSGEIYGYYVIDGVSGLLKWAERFPGSITPFTPVEGTKILINPKFEAS